MRLLDLVNNFKEIYLRVHDSPGAIRRLLFRRRKKFRFKIMFDFFHK